MSMGSQRGHQSTMTATQALLNLLSRYVLSSSGSGSNGSSAGLSLEGGAVLSVAGAPEASSCAYIHAIIIYPPS